MALLPVLRQVLIFESTIVEILMALLPIKSVSTNINRSTIVEILMALLPEQVTESVMKIYNSRNSNGFIAPTIRNERSQIYNSRNSNGFIANSFCSCKHTYLQ